MKPEGTAGVVRSYIENKVYADTKPAKFCYVIPCFRYEKPQAGRLREFHQLGVEIFGAENMIADAEVIALAMDFFERLGVGDLELRINSIGCPECRAVYRKALQDFLRPDYDELCDTCKTVSYTHLDVYKRQVWQLTQMSLSSPESRKKF